MEKYTATFKGEFLQMHWTKEIMAESLCEAQKIALESIGIKNITMLNENKNYKIYMPTNDLVQMDFMKDGKRFMRVTVNKD